MACGSGRLFTDTSIRWRQRRGKVDGHERSVILSPASLENSLKFYGQFRKIYTIPQVAHGGLGTWTWRDGCERRQLKLPFSFAIARVTGYGVGTGRQGSHCIQVSGHIECSLQQYMEWPQPWKEPTASHSIRLTLGWQPTSSISTHYVSANRTALKLQK